MSIEKLITSLEQWGKAPKKIFLNDTNIEKRKLGS